MFVQFSSSEEVVEGLAKIGRTEDLQFSPDGRRLAIAGLNEDRVLILEVESMTAEPVWNVHFSKATTLKSPTFNKPHGLAWADNEILLVANRDGQVPMVRAPRFANSSELLVHPIHVLGVSEADFVSTPGSVSLRSLGPDLLEVLICNNFAHTVSRHYLNRQGLTILGSETVIRKQLNVPDGVTYSHSGKWVAVSNHYSNSVLLYRTEDLGSGDHPAGTLRGVGYPHGISFTPDDRALFAADAGAPYAHLFVAGDADWAGNRIPVSSIKVMDDETFARGHYNPEEGGPKGLTVSPDGNLLCLTCDEQPLVLIDIREELESAGVLPRGRISVPELHPNAVLATLIAAMERSRMEFATALRREKESGPRVAAAESRIDEIHERLTGAETRAAQLEQQAAEALLRAARAESHVAETLQQLAATRAQFETSLTASGARIAFLEQDARTLKLKLDRTSRKAQRTLAQLRHAERRIRQLLGTSSWRLTAPLRALKNRFSARPNS